MSNQPKSYSHATPKQWKDVTIKAFRPQAIRYEEKCPGLPGLRLEIMPSGSRSFIVRYTYGGRYTRLTLGQYPKCSLAKAHELYQEAQGHLMSGRDPAAEFRKRRSGDVADNDTITAYVETFKRQRYASGKGDADQQNGRKKKTRRKVGPGSRAYYNLTLDAFAKKHGAKDIHKITAGDVQKFVDDAVERGDAAQRTCWKVLRAFFNWASPRAGIANPIENIEAPSEDTERKRFLTDDEIKIVWKAATDAGGPPGNAVKLLLLTGCRRKEIFYLPRADVKPDKLVFSESLTKNREPHSVPRTWLIDRVLADCPKGGKFVVTGTDWGLGGHSKARAAIKTDLEHWTFHDLRRSFASGLARLGVAIHVTEFCLNHKTGVKNKPLVRIYQQHDYADDVAAAFEKWSDHVAALVGVTKAKVAA